MGKAKAEELRSEANQKYIFAACDATHEDGKDLLDYRFQLMLPSVLRGPRFFVFQGDKIYWEDPSLTPDDFSLAKVDAMMNSFWAKQDESMPCWMKQKVKTYFRKASHTWPTLI